MVKTLAGWATAAVLIGSPRVVFSAPGAQQGGPSAGGASALTPAKAEELVREISAAVEDIRGLKFKTAVTVEIIDREAARDRIKAQVSAKEEEEIQRTQNAYVHLGLIPASAGSYARYLDDFTKEIAGFYEHGNNTFYLLNNVSADDVRSVMAHELTHALEDQNYGLDSVYQKAKGESDYGIAIRSVIEGSAMAVSLAYWSREMGGKKAREELEKDESKRVERASIAPSFTQRSFMMPYLLGFTFLLRGKPWEWYLGGGVRVTDIDQAYKNPPFSTRQILHPEQYWVGHMHTPPERFTFPDLSPVLGKGWSKVTDGSVGELGLSVLTGSRQKIDMQWALLPTRWTNPAATGTVGDVYHHYVNGEHAVTVLLTRWETEQDAEEFDGALLSKGRYFFRYGIHVLVIAGDIGDRGEAVAIAALQGAKFWTKE